MSFAQTEPVTSVQNEIDALLPSAVTSLSLRGVWAELKHLAAKPVGELTVSERREILQRLEEPLQLGEYDIAPQILTGCKTRLGFVLQPHPLFVQETASRFLHINRLADVEWAQTELEAEAESIGFSPRDSANVGRVARELAENLILHAGGGLLTYNVVHGTGQMGIQLVVEDEGPGISADVLENAASFWLRNAQGHLRGLAVARKYAHRFSVRGNGDQGTVVSCRFWSSQPGKAQPEAA